MCRIGFETQARPNICKAVTARQIMARLEDCRMPPDRVRSIGKPTPNRLQLVPYAFAFEELREPFWRNTDDRTRYLDYSVAAQRKKRARASGGAGT